MINFDKQIDGINNQKETFPNKNQDINQKSEKLLFDNINSEQVEDTFSPNNESADNYPIEIKDKKNVLTASYDEQGNFCIEYNDNTKEIFSKNDKGKLVLSEKIKTTLNGYTVEYFDDDGKNITGKSNIVKKYNQKTDTYTVTDNYKSKDGKQNSVSTYEYEGNEESYDKLKSFNLIQKYNGTKFQTYFKFNRNENSEIISVEQTEKKEDGSSTYYRFDGKRGEDAFREIINGGFYQGIPNENIEYDKKGKMMLKLINEINKTGALESVSQYDKNNKLSAKDDDFYKDNKLGTAFQGHTGDCYLLSVLNSFAQNDKLQDILRQNISETIDENGQKLYTVKLPGAQIARESLKNHLDENKIYIKDSYTISQAEMDAANSDVSSFSYGDLDVLMYELVFDKYRKDVQKTVEENNINPEETGNLAGIEGYENPDNPIDGGFGSEVKFILTGKQPEFWYKPNYKEDEVGVMLDSVTHKAQIKKNIHVETSSYEIYNSPQHQYRQLDGFMETAKSSCEQSKFDELIQRVLNDAKDGSIDENVVTVGINVGYPGDKVFGPHEVSVVAMNEKEVTIIDSNDRTVGEKRRYTMSMEDFKRCITTFDVLTIK